MAYRLTHVSSVRSRSLALAFVVGAALPLMGARPASAEPPPAPAPTATGDAVFLKNGGYYRGTLTELVPGDHVTILVEGGEKKTIPWADVDRVVAVEDVPNSKPPALPPSGQPAPQNPAAPSPAELPPAEPPPRTEWQPNRPLLVTGAISFAVGYGPNVLAAAPSTIGFAARVLLFVGTAGMALFLCIDDNGSYLCEGQHGAMQLLVPVAGPFLFAANHPHDSVLNENGAALGGTTKAFLYTSGGLQIAGVGTILAALIAGKQELVPGRKKSDASPSFFVAPQGGANTVGLGFGLRNW